MKKRQKSYGMEDTKSETKTLHKMFITYKSCCRVWGLDRRRVVSLTNPTKALSEKTNARK